MTFFTLCEKPPKSYLEIPKLEYVTGPFESGGNCPLFAKIEHNFSFMDKRPPLPKALLRIPILVFLSMISEVFNKVISNLILCTVSESPFYKTKL